MQTMRGKSMFGEQPLSTRASAANHGFGTSTRAHQAKLFAGGLAAAKSVDPSTPGPRYHLPNHVGTRYSFGSQKRFGVPGHRSAAAAVSPGEARTRNTIKQRHTRPNVLFASLALAWASLRFPPLPINPTPTLGRPGRVQQHELCGQASLLH